MKKITCTICPHGCSLSNGQIGLCKARGNQDDVIRCLNYGKLTGCALDPIEKKPFRHFYPGSFILSVGSFGCNFHCPFCQNHAISMPDEFGIHTVLISPEKLVKYALDAKKYGNIGLAYTYNEPIIGYEFVRDCCLIAKDNQLKNVLVTNGYASQSVWQELLLNLDAVNIDLKAFHPSFYQKIGGDLDIIKENIISAVSCCHVEITSLIIPGENDSIQEMESLSQWLSSIDPNIPLHITRFFPQWEMSDREPTPVSTIYLLAQTARKYLKYVYEGNC